MQNFKSLILGFCISAFLWGIAFIFLEKIPTFYIPIKKDYSFFSIRLTHLFFNKNLPIKKDLSKIYNLKGVELLALYKDKNRGFVVLKDKNKTYFVDLNKTYNGYKLIEIGQNYAIFEKNGNRYKLTLEKIKPTKNYKIITPPKPIKISKDTIREYTYNFNKIWNNIGIVKVKKGYMITYLNPKSIFAKIGLKRGDIFVEVNGIKLKSDADAWYIYKHLNKFKTFEIKILRNNKEKVLYYEMD